MLDALAASLIDVVAGLQLGPTRQDASDRFSLEGLTLGAERDGAREIGVRRFEAVSLMLASGPLMLEVGQLAVHQLSGLVRVDAGGLRLGSLQAAKAELSGVKLRGPLVLSRQARSGAHALQGHGGAPRHGDTTPGQQVAGAWRLGPLAAADGLIRAEIVDAHLLFDADVKAPIRQGRIDFNQATVEHVGPDSRMGVSRMGLYVDAPNGRSYLYQFPAAAIAGVQYERRGALLGPLVSDRGSLGLQAFGEGLLGQAPCARGPGFTEQARLLLDRTALSGEVQLGDGTFALPGVRAELAGRAEGRNAVRLHSEAVGRGVAAEVAALSVRNAAVTWKAMQLACDEVTGALLLRLFVEGPQLRFALDLADLKMTGLRFGRPR